jgi:hypothetical protein
MIEAIVILHSKKGILDSQMFRAHTWKDIVYQVRASLAIEVNPYWPWGSLRMEWRTSDRRVSAALFGVAVSFGMTGTEDDRSIS